MWYYKLTESEPTHKLWTVMFEEKDGNVVTDSDHSDREEAAKRVHWLNGGNVPPDEKAVYVDALNDIVAFYKNHHTIPESFAPYKIAVKALENVT